MKCQSRWLCGRLGKFIDLGGCKAVRQERAREKGHSTLFLWALVTWLGCKANAGHAVELADAREERIEEGGQERDEERPDARAETRTQGPKDQRTIGLK